MKLLFVTEFIFIHYAFVLNQQDNSGFADIIVHVTLQPVVGLLNVNCSLSDEQ